MTLQPSEAAPVGIYADSYFGSAWWAWTAPGSGWYRLMVVGAGYDQVASVWTGTAVGSLVPVHSNTGGGDQNSVLELYFPAISGTRYPIAVGNAYSVAGVPVSLTITSAEPPVYNASLTVSASSVNVTGASANVNAVLRMISTQPLTGGRLTISNEANYYEEVSFGDGHRTSGNSTDGTYTVPLHFSRYFEPGGLPYYQYFL